MRHNADVRDRYQGRYSGLELSCKRGLERRQCSFAVCMLALRAYGMSICPAWSPMSRI